jgi:hypothetical protein
MGSLQVSVTLTIVPGSNMDHRSLPEHPESFPVNALVPIPGTPLEGNEVSSYHHQRNFLKLPISRWRITLFSERLQLLEW